MALTLEAAYRLKVQKLKAEGKTFDPGVTGELYASGDTLAVSSGGGGSTVGAAVVGTATVG